MILRLASFCAGLVAAAVILGAPPVASSAPVAAPPSASGVAPAADPLAGAGVPAGPERSGEELERITEEVASVMRCPVCQGLSVADSPSEAALAMREEIRELLARGYSPEQVMGYFERSYGEFVRLEPKAEGFNWTVWLAPPAILLLGVGAVALRLRSAKAQRARAGMAEDAEPESEPVRDATAPQSAARPPLDRYLDRVREEVSR